MTDSVTVADTGGLGSITVKVSSRGGPVTPASRVMARAIGLHSRLLRGSGLDWGTGTALLAITAARIPDVTSVIALERDPTAVALARANVAANRVDDKVTVVQANLFTATDEPGRSLLEARSGESQFLIANPPASSGDDGLSWRRRVLAGATAYLKPGSHAIVQISAQYGSIRIGDLAEQSGYLYGGVLETSPWVPFSLDREDLRAAIDDYAEEESRGGVVYEFRHPSRPASMSARAALAHYLSTGQDPLTRWQAHHFTLAD